MSFYYLYFFKDLQSASLLSGFFFLFTYETPWGNVTKKTFKYGRYCLTTSICLFFQSVTPSQKYSQRGGKGEVVVSFGAVQGARWTGRKDPGAGVQVNLLGQPEESLCSGYKYMFQRLRDVRNGTQQFHKFFFFLCHFFTRCITASQSLSYSLLMLLLKQSTTPIGPIKIITGHYSSNKCNVVVRECQIQNQPTFQFCAIGFLCHIWYQVHFKSLALDCF